MNGKKENANNYMIDGIDDNDTVINQYSAIPSMDAIQEFKVQTGNLLGGIWTQCRRTRLATGEKVLRRVLTYNSHL